jgi:uncharacterized NAD(P)/FAD-binding protein YdhS
MRAHGTPPTVAIVGAGLAGTLTAVQLLRAAPGPLRVLLVERTARFGPGVAYGTPDKRHLLNVPAERMSAFPDDPGHFARWAEARLGPLPAGSYLPRPLYGAYVRSVLGEAERSAARGRAIERVEGEGVDARVEPGGVRLQLADGRTEVCDQVVLALGSPRCPRPDFLPDDPRVVLDPWAPGALDEPPATTLVLGAGLTAVDVALSACDTSPAARVVSVSRRGRLPFAHLPGLRDPAPPPALPPGPLTVETLELLLTEHIAAMRDRGHDWRDVVDGLRPHVSELWARMDETERRRFLEHRHRAWEVRRHRMAPDVAWRLAALCSQDRFATHAGTAVGARADRDALAVHLGKGAQPLRAGRVVVCTGLMMDVTRTTDPLLRTLLASGRAVPDPLGLGLRTGPDGALLDDDGRPSRRLFTLGALRRGDLWESTAAGEIRAQAHALAARLAPSLHQHGRMVPASGSRAVA